MSSPITDAGLAATTPVDASSAVSEKFSSRMPIFFVVVSVSLLLAIALLGNNLIQNINANNADIRINRAGRAAAAIVEANLADITVNTSDDNAPTSIQLDADRLEPSATFNVLLDTIAGVNEGAANIFRLNAETNSYDRITTTFRSPAGERVGGTMVEPGLLVEGHPAFENLRSGQTFVGEVPVAGRLRLAYLTPLLDSAEAPIGILAVDVGFVDDLGRINSETTRNTILWTSLALAIVLAAAAFFVYQFARPIYQLIGLANGLGSRDSAEVAAQLESAADEYAGRRDEVGALARGLGKVGGLRSQLENQAYFDSLTKLPNRSTLMSELAERFRAGDDHRFAVTLLGIDRFKLINDSLGQQVGDELLVAYADRVELLLRSDEYLARVGGDEFAVITPMDNVHGHWPNEINRRLARASALPFGTSVGETQVSVTSGIALARRDGAEPETLMANADLALQEGKRNVRGSFQVFHPRLSQGFERQIQLVPELRQAVEHGSLDMAFQPVFDRSGYVETLEGLTSWDHAEMGVVPPDELLQLAESAGMISFVGEWSLERACVQLQDWAQLLANVPSISINVSNMHLRHEDLTSYIAELFKTYPAASGKLVLEVDGTTMNQEDAEWRQEVFGELDRLGVVLSVDGFGNDFASLAEIERLPVQMIKIDRRLVAQAAQYPRKLRLLESMVDSINGHKSVVLQGIEQPEMLESVATVAGDLFQGSALAEPMSADYAMSLLNKPHSAVADRVGARQ